MTDGRLILRGNPRLQTPGGERREIRAALCRCGASTHKPLCDGTHAKIGWKSEGKLPRVCPRLVSEQMGRGNPPERPGKGRPG